MALRVQFLKDLLAHVPEDQRSTVEAALDRDEVQNLAANRIQAQSDLSRAMDKIRDDRTALEAAQTKVNEIAVQQKEWYDANLPVLEAGRKALNGEMVTPPASKPEVPADVARVSDIEKIVNQREAGAVAFIAATTQLGLEHYAKFGTVLDVNQLVSDPEIGKLGLRGAYEKIHGDALRAVATEAETKRIDEIVNARLAEERKQFANRPPYPVAGSEVSPLDVLQNQNRDPNQFSAEAAADEYLVLASKRSA